MCKSLNLFLDVPLEWIFLVRISEAVYPLRSTVCNNFDHGTDALNHCWRGTGCHQPETGFLPISVSN